MTPGRRLGWGSAVRYAFAAATVLAAQGLRVATVSLTGTRLPFLFFFPAIMAAGWWGGLGAGIFALAASAALAALVFEPGFGVWMANPSDWAAFALFVPVAGCVVASVEAARRARQIASRHKDTLDQALDAARMGYWSWDPASGATTWSENFESVHGLAPGAFGVDFSGFLARVHPEDRPGVKAALDAALREASDFEMNYRVDGSAGRSQWINSHGRAILDHGQPVRVTGVAMNITERRSGQAAERLLAAIVSSSDDAIISKDLDGKVLSWNRAAERLFGYGADEMVGRSIEVLMPPDRSEDYRAIIARIARGERVEHYETMRRRKDGGIIEVAVTASPVRDEAGVIVAVSKTARDLTQIREIERDRQRTRELFLATLGHDLRNPLNAISASLFYLRRHAPDNLQHIVERMSTSSGRMARMIEQLLDFTRTRLGGGIELDPKPSDLRQICRTIVAELEAQHAPRLRLAEGEEVLGEWDVDRLGQVVSNLIVNALDHGSADAPVEIEVYRDADEAVLEVRNQGEPIPEAMREAVFQPFRRGPGEQRGPSRGLGLGLYISREIVRAHGGTIAVGHESGQIVFAVRLPTRIVPRPDRPSRVALTLPPPEPARPPSP